VARVELTARAIEGLDRLIITHSLPADTYARVYRSLSMLERFPKIGREVAGRWQQLRFILGPWRWLLIVYVYDDERELVSILTIQDARSSASVTNLVAPR
jgi:hypothetical protein